MIIVFYIISYLVHVVKVEKINNNRDPKIYNVINASDILLRIVYLRLDKLKSVTLYLKKKKKKTAPFLLVRVLLVLDEKLFHV